MYNSDPNSLKGMPQSQQFPSMWSTGSGISDFPNADSLFQQQTSPTSFSGGFSQSILQSIPSDNSSKVGLDDLRRTSQEQNANNFGEQQASFGFAGQTENQPRPAKQQRTRSAPKKVEKPVSISQLKAKTPISLLREFCQQQRWNPTFEDVPEDSNLAEGETVRKIRFFFA